MALRVIVGRRIDSIGVGATGTDSYTFAEDGTLARVAIMRDTGAALTASTVTLLLNGEPLTKERVPANIFQPDRPVPFRIDRPISAGDKIDIALVNGEGAAINIFWVLEITG